MSDHLDREIERVNQHTRAMLNEYVAWDQKITVGEIQYSSYDDMIDFINFRMETADSCLMLIENGKISDSLGLCRSLLEYYLLLTLMCRGRKLIKVQDLSALTEGQFKARLKEEREKLEELHHEGKAQHCVEVKRAPRVSRRLMHVYEGLRSKEDSEFIVPVHYFQFREFRPEQMRLNNEDYFEYYEREPETKKILKGHRDDAALNYKFYLSYDGLLECLALNELIDEAVIARIEAHYTFLGKFLHPTHDAARDLHDRSNWHRNRTGLGIEQPYSKVSVLLASLYVCYLVAGLLDEISGLIEGAPSKYISQAGTEELRVLTRGVPENFPYFWFLFNDPPLWDRFNYCVHHATDDELQAWGGYAGVPKERVPFDQYIYGHLERAVGGAGNARCGRYPSPIFT
ncbi:hypothetical protein [Streptomyces pseudovenezuelae]|uniref:Uncharacterized protein n=1 Tax=Streptomyces pseudovenezuelae TaxID=67350 RepID=A0ABT6LN59_9ACTN|nr:hypothetical protein [Streptomyces pseudovenezuelae]MDH6217091.1 hypothetical protein [Streptomyces pseudovenezuelae]